MNHKIFWLLALISLNGLTQPDNRDFSDFIETHLVESAYTGTVYTVQVSLPKGYHDSPQASFPVLYALDGMHSLPLLNDIRQYMELDNSLEDMIIVGIQGNLPRKELMRHRIPDYTPNRDTTYEARFARIMDIPKASMKSGHALDFLNSLSGEIIPFVEEQYRINEKSGLLGHSLAGLFTGFTLINKPGLFDFYALSSPILTWNNGEFLLNQEPFKIPEAARVLITAGGKEERLHTSLQEFCKLLQAEEDEDLTFRIFEGESHFSVVAGSFARALHIFAGKK